jgi:hypothetical protein
MVLQARGGRRVLESEPADGRDAFAVIEWILKHSKHWRSLGWVSQPRVHVIDASTLCSVESTSQIAAASSLVVGHRPSWAPMGKAFPYLDGLYLR